MHDAHPLAHAYARLTPDLVLDALEHAGLRGDGRLLQLNSYENRVFLCHLEDGGSVVVKFYRPQRWTDAQILEEHAFAWELAQAEIPVVAPCVLSEALAGRTLGEFEGFRFSVSPRHGGRAPELDDAWTLQRLGRFLGRLHAVGRRQPFVHRPTLDVHGFGEELLAWLLNHGIVPADVAPAWTAAAQAALDGVRRCFEAAGPVAMLRLHGDCHVGNILWTDAGPHFVDLDDARMGPAVQDLWMLLSGDRSARTHQLSQVLAGYEDFMPFERRELHLVEALRTLRQLHFAAWLARRWDDPAFPAAFPWFGSSAWWSGQVVQLREQLEAMAEPPLAV
ncbi:serine/threonine protein kinase [Caldimonas manganoxidans]|uniref:serine/threonine protein kinase n=1 Tax=Caldimonas manganoxidans TaxID=196015 RepID=UPI0003734E18|nr:serine/threonine protein kinase [Caldimonas manganoxidans]